MKAVCLAVFLIASFGVLSPRVYSHPPHSNYTDAESLLKSEGFIGVFLVKRDGTDILRKGFGSANVAQKIPNRIDTQYRIGSLSKTLTALAVVQLKNTGKIPSYDTPVSHFVKDYPRGDEITLRHLLTHRSGIPEFFNGIDHSESFSPLELVNLTKFKPLEFEPGEKYSYSNSNYILLGYLIELISGYAYKQYLSQHILEELGLDHTGYGESTISQANHAQGYTTANQAEPANYIDMSIPYSAGALSSNLADLETWSESIATGSLISAADKEDVFAERGYGFGWVTSTVAGKKVYTQSGGIYGFSALIVIFPEENHLIIGLSNIEGQQPILKQLAATIAENEF
ncbi:penicillin-binding protein [Microbulbifer sp. A4B17]|uniref:serine hydrolase domain-containing protein n=1 Tax=Microbulbifer sp. A4B17 TaxID=359370 RepID=UPI000D52D48C|nr:serine hydrolase domain-containing protein [Microbulbifer sp. A4B17]AWF81423.1 penicillin-binding protein [Microbulbifer sp. A4B17]